jgi:hypothetical protein
VTTSAAAIAIRYFKECRMKLFFLFPLH